MYRRRVVRQRPSLRYFNRETYDGSQFLERSLFLSLSEEDRGFVQARRKAFNEKRHAEYLERELRRQVEAEEREKQRQVQAERTRKYKAFLESCEPYFNSATTAMKESLHPSSESGEADGWFDFPFDASLEPKFSQHQIQLIMEKLNNLAVDYGISEMTQEIGLFPKVVRVNYWLKSKVELFQRIVELENQLERLADAEDKIRNLERRFQKMADVACSVESADSTKASFGSY